MGKNSEELRRRQVHLDCFPLCGGFEKLKSFILRRSFKWHNQKASQPRKRDRLGGENEVPLNHRVLEAFTRYFVSHCSVKYDFADVSCPHEGM